ncbi:SWIM zinc finger family protein [Quillaja saponaria]|uniref:SWIM zinc finger family protein n=1 Tax=Quillaja saponaria TaxID=32244 RepID=A0AAD7P7R5_QUISA|nr:SWIM zinc finger family protein [Quillaja saponaria]KAJ7945236.1 SWIM zinc finger family protein [Quillaja saponaria]
MDIVESVFSLPVQDPPEEDFCSADLTWTKFGTAEHQDDVALIPYDRVDAFIIGECSIVECPTRFHIERGRKRTMGSLKEYKDDEYLEYRQYWCSFGPENYGEGGGILPSRRYRLNTRNRAARPQSMRGCICHFVVKRLYARPSLALIIYNERRHVNKSGFVCHGPLDRDAIGPGAKKIPYICNEIQQQTMSMIYLGIPEENILEKHIEGIQRYCAPDAKVNSLASQYVHKLGMIVKRSTHELDLDDQASIRMWVERNRKSIFFYQDTSETDPFILGIQTEWQLQQMIRFGHCSLIAADSTFGIKRLKYPLFTLLVFDSRQHALPVAWVVTRSFAKPDMSKWLKALLDRARSIEPGWKISGFLIDDAAAEIDPIRDIFCCPVLFSLWRVRRSWLRNIVKKCSNIEVQREIFKRLGKIVCSIWDGVNTSFALEEFVLDFVDQTAFLEYFRTSWVPKLEMWISTIRSLPVASQEASGAIEAYHVKLKAKLFDDSHLGALQRVDWLVHKLTTELHSSYWLDRYADESDSFQNVKEEYIASTSWHRALQIPDSAVTLDDKDHLFAKVLSQKDSSLTHLVWNPGSEFAFCDCSWSMQGNLCKHVIKVNMICRNIQGYQLSKSFLSFKEILMNLWKKPMDDSVELDQANAWTHQMLDQMQKLVELNTSTHIGTVVDKMPLKWVSKKGRTSVGKPSSTLALPHGCAKGKSPVARKKNRKRKRLSRLR